MEQKQTNESILHHIWASLAATVLLLMVCCGVYPLIVWGIAQIVFPVQANGSLVTKAGRYTTTESEAVGSALLGQNFAAAQYFHPRPSSAGNGYDASNSGGSNLGPLSDKLLNGATNPATTQPTPQAESLAFDGIRLRAIHYAVDNGISFKLYSMRADGTGQRNEVPLSKFEDAHGNLNDIALVDAFPHPVSDPPERIVVVADDFSTPIPADAVTASGSGLDPHITPANAKLQAPRIGKSRDTSEADVQALIEQYTDGPDLKILGESRVNVLLLNLALDAKYPLPPGK